VLTSSRIPSKTRVLERAWRSRRGTELRCREQTMEHDHLRGTLVLALTEELSGPEGLAPADALL